MANKKKQPKKEIMYFAGKGKQSVYLEPASESAMIIDDYRGLAFSSARGRIIITPETNNSVGVVVGKGKVRTVFVLQGDNRDLRNISKDNEKFQGIVLLVYHCENMSNAYHILFCDTRNDAYRNICIDTFGYECSDVMGTVFEILSAPYLNISNEFIQDIKPKEFISDNSKQDAALLN